jgi:hypothetical protein
MYKTPVITNLLSHVRIKMYNAWSRTAVTRILRGFHSITLVYLNQFRKLYINNRTKQFSPTGLNLGVDGPHRVSFGHQQFRLQVSIP